MNIQPRRGHMKCFFCGRPTDQIFEGTSLCNDCLWLQTKMIFGVIALIVVIIFLIIKF